jgi:hypothetical protein
MCGHGREEARKENKGTAYMWLSIPAASGFERASQDEQELKKETTAKAVEKARPASAANFETLARQLIRDDSLEGRIDFLRSTIVLRGSQPSSRMAKTVTMF